MPVGISRRWPGTPRLIIEPLAHVGNALEAGTARLNQHQDTTLGIQPQSTSLGICVHSCGIPHMRRPGRTSQNHGRADQ